MDRTALSQLSKDELITLLLAQEERHQAALAAMQARIAELERNPPARTVLRSLS